MDQEGRRAMSTRPRSTHIGEIGGKVDDERIADINGRWLILLLTQYDTWGS
jgi:hypothetical protein